MGLRALRARRAERRLGVAMDELVRVGLAYVRPGEEDLPPSQRTLIPLAEEREFEVRSERILEKHGVALGRAE